MTEAVLRQEISLRHWRFWCLPGAVLVYAFWGSPTPDRIGWPEIITGLLLIAAIGLSRAARSFSLDEGVAWERAGKLLLIYGLTFPVVAGLAAGNGVAAMIRDVIPFLFMLMPLFLFPLLNDNGGRIRILTGVVVFLGIAFSMRVLLPTYRAQMADVTDPFLLANAPTVLFSALLLAGGGGWLLYRSRLAAGLFCLIASLLPLVTMALITQRASIGVFCLAMTFLLAVGLWHRPLRTMLPLLVLAAVLAVFWPAVADTLQGMMRKTALVGFNMRWQETLAVIDALDGSVFSVIFGRGWGAAITSPAVGGATVNFTHSLLTTYWLKTGLIGMGLAVFYLYRLALLLWPVLWRYPVLACALAGPFAIDVFLYASFKSLDFGLLLLLIPLWTVMVSRQKLAKKRPL